jgi:hypothetical protein
VAINVEALSRRPDTPSECYLLSHLGDELYLAFEKLENARAALDIYRSDGEAWERAITQGNWPCALPPSTFSRCYL